MGYRYEYEDVDVPIISSGFDRDILDIDPSAIKCTIYDEDTDEELASGVGNDEYDARRNAEDKL